MDKKPFALWLTAFACPVVAFLAALMSRSEEQQATQTGEYGAYRKCPFCAEPVRKEAVKCKHCHSDLPPLN